MLSYVFVFLIGARLDLSTDQIKANIGDAYRRNRDHYQCNVTISSLERRYDSAGVHVLDELQHDFKSNNDSFLLKSTIKKKANPRVVSPTGIWIGRSTGIYRLEPKGSNWIIVNKISTADDQRLDICRAEKGLSLPFAEFELGNERLLSLKDLTIKGASQVVWHDTDAIKVDVHREIRKGVEIAYYFDPINHWALLGSETRTSSGEGGVTESKVDYDPITRDPTKWRYSFRRPDGTSRLISETEIVKFLHERHSVDEFTFTQFGLPEVESKNAKPSSLEYRWWFVSATVGLLMLLLFGWFRRRRHDLIKNTTYNQ